MAVPLNQGILHGSRTSSLAVHLPGSYHQNWCDSHQQVSQLLFVLSHQANVCLDGPGSVDKLSSPSLESLAHALANDNLSFWDSEDVYGEAKLFYSPGVTDCIKESVEDDLPLRHRRRIYLIANYYTKLDDHRHARISASPSTIPRTNCNGIIMATELDILRYMTNKDTCSAWNGCQDWFHVHCVSEPRQAWLVL